MSLRILHCPTTVGSNAYTLSRAERDIGYESLSISLDQNYLNYPVDEVVFKGPKWSPLNEVRRWKWIFRSLKNYDVIHYNFGQTLAPVVLTPQGGWFKRLVAWIYNNLYAHWFEMLDLVVAHKIGRVTAVMYQGDDARQGDYCRKHYSIHFCHAVDENYYSDETDELKKKRIAKVDRYADIIYAVNPDLLNVLPPRAKFLPYSNVNIRDWIPVAPTGNDVPHIVHAPSHRDVKGTKYIVDAIARLRAENIPLKFTLVEKMANAEARKAYETADLLVDQLLAGFYGGLSVEFMSLGKPVICYMRNEDMRYLPEQMRLDLPIINATPDSIYEVIKEWLTTRKSQLAPLGIRSRAYVEKWHDPIEVAKMVTGEYQSAWKGKRL